MTWIFFQIFLTALSGIFVPDSAVVIPESTLVPPQEIIEIVEQEQEKDPEPPALPSYLFIPSINVSAEINPVGLTENGAVGVPVDPGTLGWFEKSPHPGDAGSAIIDGHRGWRNKTPAVFDYLHEIEIGDIVVVMNDKGETMAFQVYDMKTYDPDESPFEVFEQHDTPHLNLITCNGEWNTETRSATKRLVVFTKMMETQE